MILSIFSCAGWSFAYLWRNVYSSTLHIFYVVCFLLSCRSSLYVLGFPGSSAGKESACNAGGLGSVPGLGRSPGEGKGYPLQYSCLENSMNGVALSTTEQCLKEPDMTERLSFTSLYIFWIFIHHHVYVLWCTKLRSFIVLSIYYI